MREFIVRRFSEAGVPESEMSKVEAENELEAAEKACGIKLTSNQRPQMYMRADVRTVRTMNEHHPFYAVE
jgi:hypothetical protein